MMLLLLFLSLLLGPLNTHPHITLKVDPRVALPPADVRVIVRVDSHPDNRRYMVMVDGENFYTSSVWPLDGDQAPITQPAKWYKHLPGGSYTITAVLFQTTGEIDRVATTVTVSEPE